MIGYRAAEPDSLCRKGGSPGVRKPGPAEIEVVAMDPEVGASRLVDDALRIVGFQFREPSTHCRDRITLDAVFACCGGNAVEGSRNEQNLGFGIPSRTPTGNQSRDATGNRAASRQGSAKP